MTMAFNHNFGFSKPTTHHSKEIGNVTKMKGTSKLKNGIKHDIKWECANSKSQIKRKEMCSVNCRNQAKA